MHPLNSSLFGSGTGKIRVTYHNGTAVVTGYVVKQLGSKRFLVTTNGTDKFIVHLKQTITADSDLTVGRGTIKCTTSAGADYVVAITSKRITTASGKSLTWSGATATTTNAVIDKF